MTTWLGWAWKSGHAACRACVDAGHVPEHFPGSGYRVTVYDAAANFSAPCGACGAIVTGENCIVGEVTVSNEIKLASEATANMAREVIARVQWTNPDALPRLRAFEIVNDEQQEFAAQLLREVKAEQSLVEGERKKITKPLNDAAKATNALFKPVLTALEEAESALKGKIAGYMAAKQSANVAALQAASTAPTAMAAAQSMDLYAPVAAPQGISVRQVTKFEVTDPDLVPRHLCSPDMQKISTELQKKSDKYGQPDLIPGVRVFQEPVVSSRRV